MLLQASGRLKVYSSIAFFSLLIMLMEIPIADTGTWLGVLSIVGIAVWVELSDYFVEGDNPENKAEKTEHKDDTK
ncbi:hypothetical protein FR932_17920 [Moritella marina ATCC 15381]|uniref:Uncharacterized protein n=1 Tax=Moritella marina ATCC 15381 TaxID=1202962 RepID=A0A5J6WT17_MORMI|nr:hypothetical protein [Moritella marina]QFI39562.1 hypothetical protein FR932_17920 [Moritella marina ATCC 15381]